MKDLKSYGGWALITGASSGLGREFARLIAAQGVNCVLVGLGEADLRSVSDELSAKHNVKCRPLEIDLSDADFLDRLSSAIEDLPIGILVNCAGIAVGGAFHTRDPKKLERLVNLNCLAPVLLTRAYLPKMLERGAGAVITVSSLQGFISCPNETVYCASKAFLLHFGESLWGELRNTPIDCLTVCPAGMKTDFFRAEGLSPADCDRMWSYSSPPASVAALALRKLGKKPLALPAVALAVGILTRIMPRRWTTGVTDYFTRRLVNHAEM